VKHTTHTSIYGNSYRPSLSDEQHTYFVSGQPKFNSWSGGDEHPEDICGFPRAIAFEGLRHNDLRSALFWDFTYVFRFGRAQVQFLVREGTNILRTFAVSLGQSH